MFSQVGPLEIILIIIVLLIVFGPKRLPSLGRSLGSGIREFKESITGEDKHADEAEATARPALGEAQSPAPTGTSAPPVGSSAAQGGGSAPEQRT